MSSSRRMTGMPHRERRGRNGAGDRCHPRTSAAPSRATLVEEGCTLQLAARYLAKDARYGPERLREGYPCFGAFEAVRAVAAGVPPGFASELSRRLVL